MKFKKVKSSDVSTGLVQVGGAGVGFMATNGLANAIAKVDDEALMTEEQKKTKMYVAVASILVGGALVVALDGNDTATMGIKAIGIGMSAGGVKGLVSHFAKDSAQTMPANTTTATTMKRFVAGALGCPCEERLYSPPSLNRPSLNRPSSLRSASNLPVMPQRQERAGVYDNFTLA